MILFCKRKEHLACFLLWRTGVNRQVFRKGLSAKGGKQRFSPNKFLDFRASYLMKNNLCLLCGILWNNPLANIFPWLPNFLWNLYYNVKKLPISFGFHGNYIPNLRTIKYENQLASISETNVSVIRFNFSILIDIPFLTLYNQGSKKR